MKTRPQTDLTRIRNQEYLRIAAGLIRGEVKDANNRAKRANLPPPDCTRATNAELAETLGVSVASVTRYIARLEEIGVIETEYVPGIGRKIKVLLTARETKKLLEEGSWA